MCIKTFANDQYSSNLRKLYLEKKKLKKFKLYYLWEIKNDENSETTVQNLYCLFHYIHGSLH